jgi:Thermolysin metallopeptidase, catalytic domain
MKATRKFGLAAAMVIAAGAAVSADQVPGLPQATNELLSMYPGTEVLQDQGRVLAFYGMPMTPGVTPAAAVDLFLQHHLGAFGVGNAELVPLWDAELGNGRHTVFAFAQQMDGMPVEHGVARILVLKGPINRVVYATGTLAARPAVGWPAMTVTAEQAVARVRALKQYSKLPVFSNPALVVYQGEGEWTEPVRAWKFVAEEPNLRLREKWTFFIDAASGSLIHVRNEILNDDVVGTVRGMATPGFLPDEASNPPVSTALAQMRVNVTDGQSAYSDLIGNFTIPNEGVAPVQLTSTVGPAGGSGRWCAVDNRAAGGELVTTLNNVIPGTPANLVMNVPPGAANSLTTAQINAFVHTTKIHNFYRDRSGSWDLIDVSLPVNVNLSQTCNAFWDGSSTNFFQAGGGCVNTAYSDVVGHEYGHFVVQSLGLGQGGFGEGFADSGALLCLDSGPILGRDFMGAGSFVRNVQSANQQYPCSNPDPHVCGQILGGVWWGIRVSMGTFYGSANGLARTQQLFVDWMLITTGGSGSGFSNSANPNTAVQVLTLNDDDGDLTNGTPDYSRICPNFSQHNIQCPPAPPVGFQFPNGLPTLFPPNQQGEILVNVIPMASTPAPNTGKIDYRLNGGSFTEVNMTSIGTNQYRAVIPAQPCNTNVDYYFKATATNNQSATSPLSAPADTYYVPFADAILPQYSDNFEANVGWSGEAPEDTAITGRWTWGIPQPTAAQPGSDHTPTGTYCWVTDYRAGQQVSDYDVDDGQTTLTSPLFDASAMNSPRVTFWLWYSNNVGPVNPGTNIFVYDVSNDDGVSWHRVRTIGPAGAGTTGRWKQYGFTIADIVPPTSRMRVRFIASDYTGAIVEAAVDDFLLTSLQCPPAFCYANCDGSTTVPILNISDFVCFLNRFQSGESYANCDNSTTPPVLNIQDFVCFSNAFSAGCT